MKKTEKILLVCALIQTVFIFLDYVGVRPTPNWPFWITKFFIFLQTKIPLIWCIISSTIVALIVIYFSRKKPQKDAAKVNHAKAKSLSEKQENIPQSLSEKKKDVLEELEKEELYILVLLTHLDGFQLTIKEMQRNISCSNLRLKNAVNNLKKKYLIKNYNRPYSFEIESYVLTDKGQKLVIDLDWDEKVKQPRAKQSNSC